MIKLFYRLFNHNKIDEIQKNLDIYKERNSQLEKEVREYKGYKLKYEVTKLYVEDDDALVEIMDAAKKYEQYISLRQHNAVYNNYSAAQGQSNLSGFCGQQNALLNSMSGVFG